MGKKVVRVPLTANMKELQTIIKQYEKEKLKQFETYRVRLADEIAREAEAIFNSSSVDDIISGGSPHKADVSVSVTSSGNVSIIVANGEDAVWCEFGAGVYHNGSSGGSPNPYGSGLGLTIGSYGKGKGSQKAWGFADENGNIVITHGTPATMPMYKALLKVANKSISIARKVFK